MFRKCCRAALRILSVYIVSMFLIASGYSALRDFIVAAALTTLVVWLYQKIARREEPRRCTRASTRAAAGQTPPLLLLRLGLRRPRHPRPGEQTVREVHGDLPAGRGEPPLEEPLRCLRTPHPAEQTDEARDG